VQAEEYLLMQNGSNLPFVFDGSTLRRGNPRAFGGTEFPVGTIMEYNRGRLWVATVDRRGFTGGDLVYSITGTTADLLGDTENVFINGGGIFSMSSQSGLITAMKTVAMQDSTIGQGPLQVFAEKGAASVDAPFDRTLWLNLDSALVSTSLIAPGPRSQEGVSVVNGDIWYRSNDGIRSFMIARRDHGTWVNTALSHEMDRVLNRDNQNLLDYVSSVEFDNRLLTTVSPYRATETDGTEHGFAFRGLASLDFNPVSSMFDRSQPEWEGIWTGVQILQVLTLTMFGVDKCYAFGLDSSNEITLWEFSTENQFDNVDNPISWTIETRSLGFQDDSELFKKLERVERWLENVAGSLSFGVDYRPDSFWGWVNLDDGLSCATTGVCALSDCTPPDLPQLQYRPRQLSTAPNNSCEPCTNKLHRNGFDFQFRLRMSGAGSIRRFRAVATELPENNTGGCFSTDSCCDESGCESNPWDYSIPE